MSEHNYIQTPTNGAPIYSWTRGVPVENVAWQQLRNVASMPFIYRHVAAMPDVHYGIGATVGSVIPTEEAVIPAAVGVDIGCGMIAVPTGLAASDLPDSLARVREEIEQAVPHGRSDRGGVGDRGAWRDPPRRVSSAFMDLSEDLDRIVTGSRKLEKARSRALRQLETLGGGNHFLEVCLDQSDSVWVMLHSGSRGIGNAIGTHFIELAKEDMKRWFVQVPDRDLAYFPEGTEHFRQYIAAVDWAQRYAWVNRQIMMEFAVKALFRALGRPADGTGPMVQAEGAVNCHHNYVQRESHFGRDIWLTRKGAVRARKGDLGIIPGSMGARSFIVRGKGNPDSFCSCSHGAGRAMSRGAAKRRFTVEDHIAATAGVECRKDKHVLDETPAAYKNIDAVMAAQTDLVEVVHELRQVVCVKG